MNLTNHILVHSTVYLVLQNCMNKILIDDTIKTMIVIHSGQKDAVDAVLTSKYASQKSNLLIQIESHQQPMDESLNMEPMLPLSDTTFVVNFLN